MIEVIKSDKDTAECPFCKRENKHFHDEYDYCSHYLGSAAVELVRNKRGVMNNGFEFAFHK